MNVANIPNNTVYFRIIMMDEIHPVLLSSGGILVGYLLQPDYYRQMFYSSQVIASRTCYGGISDSDYASCFRNGKIVTLVLNIKVLRPLSSFNTYLTLPKQYIPSSVMFAPVMALGTGIRIGTSGEVMPCADIGAGAYIQTTISYVIK